MESLMEHGKPFEALKKFEEAKLEESEVIEWIS